RVALAGELGPVRTDVALVVLPGNVLRRGHRDDARVRFGLRGVDPDHPGPGVIREADGAVQHLGHLHVVDVRLVAQRELVAAVPGRAGPDLPRGVDLPPRDRPGPPARRRQLAGVDDPPVPRTAAQ